MVIHYCSNIKIITTFFFGCFRIFTVLQQIKVYIRQPVHTRFSNQNFWQQNFLHLECIEVYFCYEVKLILWGFGSLNELQHDKTNKMICGPSKDSDQPGHMPRLIWVFAVHFMGRLRTECFFIQAVKTVIRLDGCLGWSEFAGCKCHFVGFVVL